MLLTPGTIVIFTFIVRGVAVEILQVVRCLHLTGTALAAFPFPLDSVDSLDTEAQVAVRPRHVKQGVLASFCTGKHIHEWPSLEGGFQGRWDHQLSGANLQTEALVDGEVCIGKHAH